MPVIGHGFSRTLVGSKRGGRRRTTAGGAFQSNPCGVEASRRNGSRPNQRRFSRTLVGSKHREAPRYILSRRSFSRTLVGSKRGVTAGADPKRHVSVEPLWGRSLWIGVHRRPSITSFSRTLVGSKRRLAHLDEVPSNGFSRTLVGSKHRTAATRNGEISVSVEPLWGRSRHAMLTAVLLYLFQSNPCGVEARSEKAWTTTTIAFQSNPCGVEATSSARTNGRVFGFSRTLVGSKRATGRLT